MSISQEAFPNHSLHAKILDALESLLQLKYRYKLSKTWNPQGFNSLEEEVVTNEFINSRNFRNYEKRQTQFSSNENKRRRKYSEKNIKFEPFAEVIQNREILEDNCRNYINCLVTKTKFSKVSSKQCHKIPLCLSETKPKLLSRKKVLFREKEFFNFTNYQALISETKPIDSSQNLIIVNSRKHNTWGKSTEYEPDFSEDSSDSEKSKQLPQWLIDATELKIKPSTHKKIERKVGTSTRGRQIKAIVEDANKTKKFKISRLNALEEPSASPLIKGNSQKLAFHSSNSKERNELKKNNIIISSGKVKTSHVEQIKTFERVSNSACNKHQKVEGNDLLEEKLKSIFLNKYIKDPVENIFKVRSKNNTSKTESDNRKSSPLKTDIVKGFKTSFNYSKNDSRIFSRNVDTMRSSMYLPLYSAAKSFQPNYSNPPSARQLNLENHRNLSERSNLKQVASLNSERRGVHPGRTTSKNG